MKRKDQKITGLRFAVKGFIAFGRYGDVWMGSHDADRLQEFIKQHPQLRLEPEIYAVSTKTGDVRIHRPHYLREKHVEALAKIPTPHKQEGKLRRTLAASALGKEG